jgi:hypothetical protein
MEVDMVSDLFNRLVSSCHSKCIPEGRGFHEGTLNKGEGVCIDRYDLSKAFSSRLPLTTCTDAWPSTFQSMKSLASGCRSVPSQVPLTKNSCLHAGPARITKQATASGVRELSRVLIWFLMASSGVFKWQIHFSHSNKVVIA